jgi:cytochrome c peroxidase
MSRWQQIGFFLVAVLWTFVLGCQPDSSSTDEEPKPDPVEYKATPYNWIKPANFPDPIYDFENNPLTVEGVALGKALFYDGKLSQNGIITCDFCHQPATAFAHTDHALSHGIEDKIGTRNVPAIQNVAWSPHFFWDGGVVDLDLLPIAPIQNPVEMGDTMANVLKKVQKDGRYPALFKAAYGSDQITNERFLKALSQFMLTMVSANSQYDKYVRKETGGNLSTQELRGLALFQEKCASCHKGELFTDQSFRNNGLPPSPTNQLPDPGRYSITLRDSDKNKFHVPSLRNVAITVPYMHDGRFNTLEAVLKHYASGMEDNPQLDPLFRQNNRVGIPLTASEQQDIIAFLRTLTDYDFITNRKFRH